MPNLLPANERDYAELMAHSPSHRTLGQDRSLRGIVVEFLQMAMRPLSAAPAPRAAGLLLLAGSEPPAKIASIWLIEGAARLKRNAQALLHPKKQLPDTLLVACDFGRPCLNESNGVRTP